MKKELKIHENADMSDMQEWLKSFRREIENCDTFYLTLIHSILAAELTKRGVNIAFSAKNMKGLIKEKEDEKTRYIG